MAWRRINILKHECQSKLGIHEFIFSPTLPVSKFPSSDIGTCGVDHPAHRGESSNPYQILHPIPELPQPPPTNENLPIPIPKTTDPPPTLGEATIPFKFPTRHACQPIRPTISDENRCVVRRNRVSTMQPLPQTSTSHCYRSNVRTLDPASSGELLIFT